MDSLTKAAFNIDVFLPKDYFINKGNGTVPYCFFITSLGNTFITNDGDYFMVKNG